jgi:hypothetical protein
VAAGGFKDQADDMGVWQKVAMDSLNYHSAMLYPSMPCRRATPEVGGRVGMVGGLRLYSTPLDTLFRIPMIRRMMNV